MCIENYPADISLDPSGRGWDEEAFSSLSNWDLILRELKTIMGLAITEGWQKNTLVERLDQVKVSLDIISPENKYPNFIAPITADELLNERVSTDDIADIILTKINPSNSRTFKLLATIQQMSLNTL